MRKLIIALMLLVGSAVCANAQVTREGKQFVQTQKAKTSTEKETGFTYKDSKGNVYPIFMGSTGSCYIKKVSQKTGKEYKQYLGEDVSSQICKELGVKYTPKSK